MTAVVKSAGRPIVADSLRNTIRKVLAKRGPFATTEEVMESVVKAGVKVPKSKLTSFAVQVSQLKKALLASKNIVVERTVGRPSGDAVADLQKKYARKSVKAKSKAKKPAKTEAPADAVAA